MFYGLTLEEIKDREKSCHYPPRLQIKCQQIGAFKALNTSFKVSKRSKSEETFIAEFPLIKEVKST